MPEIHATGFMYSFIYFYVFYFFDSDSIRTKLYSEKKMHSCQLAHFRTTLELVSNPLLSACLLENSMLYSPGRGKRPVRPGSFKYVNLVGNS